MLKAILEIISLITPIIREVFKALNDREIRAVGLDLKKAKTPDEKRDAARKIADYLSKR